MFKFSEEFLKSTEGWLPYAVIIVGLVCAGLFAWYFAAATDKTKRLTGSFLTVILTDFCVFCVCMGLKMGIDLQGGASFLVQVQTPMQEVTDPGDSTFTKGQEVEAERINEVNKRLVEEKKHLVLSENVGGFATDSITFAQEIVEQRLNPKGTLDVVVTPQGTDKLYVEIPGEKTDLDRAKTTLEQVAKLEFFLLHDERGLSPVAKNDRGAYDPVPGYKVVPHREDRKKDKDPRAAKVEEKKVSLDDLPRVLVRNRAELGGKSVKRADAVLKPGSIDWSISVELKPEFGDKMFGITSQNLSKPLGIVLDGVLLSAPTINGKFGDQFEITGSFTQQEAIDLANVLKNPLDNPMRVLQSATVSASYGQEVVKQGLMSALVGLGATLLFMMIYYRLSGIIAVFALVVNLVLLLGLMQIFGFTLTMPGIAGIILTLGMAVDANVLIYERMREEFATGKTLGPAISASYEKAFSAIFDSNVTTLITSVIMIVVASGAIQGFGISLTIGLICSMFSALIITRVCFLWLHGSGLKSLTFMHLIQNRLYDFMGKRKLLLTISAVLIVASLGLTIFKGDRALGYELKGGDVITLRGLTEEETSTALKGFDLSVGKDHYNFSNLSAQTVKPLGENAYVIVRAPSQCADAVIKELRAKLPPEKVAVLDNPATKPSTETMGASVGKSMLLWSVWAIIAGLIGIFIYLTFRFEFAFAVGAIAALAHDVIIAIGACALFGKEIGLILVGAFLTIAGYSINDTIVIFDRVRENLRTQRGDLKEILNLSISQTLSRTILTSSVTVLAVLAMLLFGGKAMADFSFAMLIGMISGVYSTMYIASPVVLWWAEKRKLNLRQQILDADAAKLEALSGLEREAPGKPGKAAGEEAQAGA